MGYGEEVYGLSVRALLGVERKLGSIAFIVDEHIVTKKFLQHQSRYHRGVRNWIKSCVFSNVHESSLSWSMLQVRHDS